MQRRHIMKRIIQFCLALTFLLSSALPGSAAELTQRDWMITLIDALGWSYGLPDEPQDPEYMKPLIARREAMRKNLREKDPGGVMMEKAVGKEIAELSIKTYF